MHKAALYVVTEGGLSGYVRHLVTPDSWTADYRRLEYVRTPGSPVSTARTFVIENGAGPE